MVEELLQTLVGVVDTQLLEGVVLKDLEASNVEHTDEVLTLGLDVKGLVDTGYEPVEHTGVEGLDQSLDTEVGLVLVLTLGHHLGADLDLGLEHGVEEVLAVNTKEEGNLLSI